MFSEKAIQAWYFHVTKQCYCLYISTIKSFRDSEINNKILNHVQTQSKMMEVVKNTRNRGMHLLLANVCALRTD